MNDVMHEAQQLSTSSKIKYGGIVHSDSTITKKYILSYPDLETFAKAWDIVKKLSNVRGDIRDFEISVSIYIPFQDYLESRLEEEE